MPKAFLGNSCSSKVEVIIIMRLLAPQSIDLEKSARANISYIPLLPCEPRSFIRQPDGTNLHMARVYVRHGPGLMQRLTMVALTVALAIQTGLLQILTTLAMADGLPHRVRGNWQRHARDLGLAERNRCHGES
jgi:hypothetical protein